MFGHGRNGGFASVKNLRCTVMNARRTILAVLIPAAAILAAGLFLVSRADAQTVVQQKTNSNNSAPSLSVTLDSMPVNANLLIMVGANVSGPLASVTGGGVATWTLASRSTINSNVEIWYGVT